MKYQIILHSTADGKWRHQPYYGDGRTFDSQEEAEAQIDEEIKTGGHEPSECSKLTVEIVD